MSLHLSGWDRGTAAWENRGGRREREGWEAGVLRGRESGKKYKVVSLSLIKRLDAFKNKLELKILFDLHLASFQTSGPTNNSPLG